MVMISAPARTVSRSTDALFRLASRIPAAMGRLCAHIIRHRRLVRISRLNPRIIRDIGHDPETIYYALKGTRDEVGPYRERRK